jgi:hypothetical protein
MEELAPSIIMRSISIESTSLSRGLPRSVCVVRPDPKPMLATLVASGFIASGSAPASTIVGSSGPAAPVPANESAASVLPLVRMLRFLSGCSITEIEAVLPSR